MSWNSIIGQQRSKEILRRAVTEGKIAHAFLFWGPEGIGKDALAIEFTKVLLCERKGDEACEECPSCRKMASLQHPNLKLVFALPASKGEKQNEETGESMSGALMEEVRSQIGEKSRNPYYRITIPRASMINISSIRGVKRESSLTAFDGGRKIILIVDADQMNIASANALLKVLEEPPDHTVFLLTSSRKDQLPATILSRCQGIRCEVLHDEDIAAALSERMNVPEQEALLIARLGRGNYRRALELVSDEIRESRNETVRFLRSILGGKVMETASFIETLTAESNRDAAHQFLLLLMTWLRDALMIREQKKDVVINIDQEDDLIRFVDRFGQADLAAAMKFVDHAVELVQRNVYLPLIFLSLSIQLKRQLLHGKKL
jgi:DNA polymerase-3 subunit delta'